MTPKLKEGQNDEAESLLQDVVTSHPELHEIEYSLGLLLAEKKEYDEAAVYLKRAALGMPDRARIHYNLGLLLQHLKRDSEAEAELSKAVTLQPDNINYLYALTEYYLKREKLQEAKPIAEQMVARHPEVQIGHNLLSIINRKLNKTN
ncbi:MAG: tetratricopeptide repeat protein [Thermodesulfobacteriota bacterium]|nr:tetratricopeptide repeat protein [Thermodesulfobacteriota bacterium]